MAKQKPQPDTLKELMRRTFPNRWDAYVSKNEPATLLEYLHEYPLLKKATYVSPVNVTCCVHIFYLHMLQAALDFSLACKDEHMRDCFEERFPMWAHAVISYCRNTQIRSSALQLETADYSGSMDDGKLMYAYV